MINLIIAIVVCTNLIINCFPAASAISTIKVGDRLNLTSHLVSPEYGIFTLGLFTVPETGYTYLGIWFSYDLSSTKVWVANRPVPIESSSSVLMIDPDTGKLVIATGGKTLVNISDNQPGPGLNLTATLLDTGDFQLKNEFDNRILWRSFDHPTNVLLPGMKLGTDLRTGRNWKLTSWLRDGILDLGAFTLTWETNGENSQRLMVRRRGQPYWTTGHLNNQTFEFTKLVEAYKYNISCEYNDEERYFSYHGGNGFTPMLILNANGQIVQGSYERLYLWSPEFCYGYDSGNGCMAGSLPPCRSVDDKFTLLNGEFTSGGYLYTPDDNPSLSFSDCMVRCWNFCDCMGFDSGQNGGSCNIWQGQAEFSVNPQRFTVPTYVLVSRSKGTKIWIWGPIVSGVFLLLFCLGTLRYLKNRKLKREEERQKDGENNRLLEMPPSSDAERDSIKGSDVVEFSFDAIITATNDFSDENKLGQGGFGPVYKGKLSDEREVAIKRLSRTSGQGLEEFRNELRLDATLQHTNLVQVLGYCIHGEEKMLIYKYMPNKSLDFFLFDETRKALLDWPKRWNIIDGIAQGLLYLHKYARTKVIHRDLKAGNVLLDESMNPKISDFGMARIFKQDETEAMSQRGAGTYGYMPPEGEVGYYSVKTDVYSFGVLLLEIVSGRRNTCPSFFNKTINLIGHAWELWKQEDELQLQDPTLAGNCVVHQLRRTVHIAFLCLQENAVDRPEMSEVISMLTNDNMSLPVPKQPAFFFGGSVSKPASVEWKTESVSVDNISITQMED